MEQITTFAERLKELIGDKSFAAFGKQVGLSKQSISAYTTGARNPKPALIKSISLQMNVTPAWLMGYDAPRAMGKNVLALVPAELSEKQKKLIDRIATLSEGQVAAVLALIDSFKTEEGVI